MPAVGGIPNLCLLARLEFEHYGPAMYRRILGCVVPTLFFSFAAGNAEANPRTVVVMLFDGFSPAAVDAYPTPALDRLRREGSFTHDFEPPFPSISLTGGVTVSTGCWPEHHGIVSNVFLDPIRGRFDHSGDADWLTGCEHLHQAAERQGVKTAALAWVGSYSKSRGPLASSVKTPDRVCTAITEPGDVIRAAEVARLLRLPRGERPRLILAYFCGPDAALHFAGLHSDQARASVTQSDRVIARVLEAVDDLPDRDDVTLLVTTDHGMQEVTTIVNISRILRKNEIEAEPVSSGTTSFLYFDDPTQVDDALAKLERYDEFDVLRRDALPAYAHLGTGPRVPQLIVSAHPPYFIEDIAAWPRWLQWLGRWGPEFFWARVSLSATHGYPAQMPGAHVNGILYAWGSGVAMGRRVARVRAIDVHPTVTRLLGIEPGQPMDGAVATGLLRPE